MTTNNAAYLFWKLMCRLNKTTYRLLKKERHQDDASISKH